MEIDEILIEEVRQRPVIYDLGLEDYKNLRKKDFVWREVASNVHLDEAMCKKRWKGLQDCYKRCKRMELSTSGSGAETPRRKWRYLEAMSFLDNVTSTRTTIGSIPEELVVIDEESSTAAETPPSSSRVRKEDERDKFEALIDLAASSITQTCSEFCVERKGAG
ncbi:transcription factor Adf-1-like [Rhagoletis pomonella]|uniref:transcription factor Adf-1-like n=1 Tax=Rhagoletis pomonella TaxID=28610 RepID=UPI00177DB5E3|nr:transcription factor Adf-1-like [Rhagoletis pomonella]